MTLSICLSIGGCDPRVDTSDVAELDANESPPAEQAANERESREIGSIDRVSGSPVSATLKLEPRRTKPGEDVLLTVTLDIEPLWEVGALGTESQVTATRLELETPDGIVAEADWKAPKSTRSIAPDGHAVYVDEAVFSRRLRVEPHASAGDFAVQCRLRYQACNDRQCLQPAEVELSATVKLE